MKLIQKVVFAFVLAMLITVVGTHAALASNDVPPPSQSDEMNNLQLSPQSYQYFLSGDSYIQGNSTSTITVSGNTKARTTVEKVGITLYLQRWNSSTGNWVDVAYMGQFSNNYSTTVHGSRRATVAKGYYYRTRSLHWVEHGGFVEQAQSVTTAIFVN